MQQDIIFYDIKIYTFVLAMLMNNPPIKKNIKQLIKQ